VSHLADGIAARPAEGIACAGHLRDVVPYDPKYLPARIYMNANENAFGLPEAVRSALSEEAGQAVAHRYPDPLAGALRERIAALTGWAADGVLVGNGGDELLLDVLMAFGGPGRSLLSCPPTFSVYAADALLTHTGLQEVGRRCTEQPFGFEVDEDALLAAAPDADIIMLASPNNPTGECVSMDFVDRLCAATEGLVLLDQAYVEFADPCYDAAVRTRHSAEATTSAMPPYQDAPGRALSPKAPLDHVHAAASAMPRNLVILRTFSKAFALAGLRVGYILAAPEVVTELKKVRQPYSVNTFSARAAELALEHAGAFEASISTLISERSRLAQGIAAIGGLGGEVAQSEANFLLLRVPGAHALWQRLYEERGILVRDFSAVPGLNDCLRITIGRPEENDELLAALTDWS
jgi:histidinol-phosphate aminotransferase